MRKWLGNLFNSHRRKSAAAIPTVRAPKPIGEIKPEPKPEILQTLHRPQGGTMKPCAELVREGNQLFIVPNKMSLEPLLKISDGWVVVGRKMEVKLGDIIKLGKKELTIREILEKDKN